MFKEGGYYIKAIATILFFMSCKFVLAQACSIVSKDNACLGDIVNFSVSAAATPISYQWKFGDGATSTQPKPSHTYSTHNTYTVELTVKLSNGSNCTVTKSVTIHPKPVSDFKVSGNSKYCFSSNNICIEDLSTPGPTGNPINSRVVLWDDGAGDNSTNPGAQKILCHSYHQEGSYNILIETTDDKGCLSKSTKLITILPDFEADMKVQVTVTPKDCKYKICLENTTNPFNISEIDEFEWSMGDGFKTNDLKYKDTICYEYKSDGTYMPYLRIKHKSGCEDTISSTVNVVSPNFNFNLKVNDTICLGDVATFFNDASNPGAKYRWYIKDSAKSEKPINQSTNPINYSVVVPSKYYIKLNMLTADGCHQNTYDTMVVKGPLAEFEAKNRYLCTPGDTTYFCDLSNYYRSYHIKRLWDFEHGAACTTDTEKGINVGMNCRYSKDISPKHLYTHTGVNNTYSCFSPKLSLQDTVTGCESEALSLVLLGLSPTDSLTIRDTAIEYCTDIGSTQSDRYVTFFIDGLSCDNSWNMFLNYDSALNPNSFSKVSYFPPPTHLYRGTADPNGNVTIGFVVRNGSLDRFASCSNKLPVSGNYCTDTVWYHHKFQLASVPNPYTPSFTQKVCAPFNLVLRPDDTVQTNVTKMVWDWGDGTRDSIFFGPNDSIVPSRYHGYTKNGLYTQVITMYNSKGCSEEQILQIGIGFQNFAAFDTIVCAGDSVELVEYISYYDKADKLWQDSARNAQNKETVRWDLGDGNFIYKKPETKVVFPTEGTYKLRMASKDSTGCLDTFEFEIKAVKADAHIRSMQDTFYCNDNIIRFYDSSFGSPQIPGDIATKWYWNFGDGKPVSRLEQPFHFYSSYGKKKVTLAVQSKEGCRDTTSIEITIVGPEPYFEILTDSIGCEPHTVVFKNSSTRVKTWIWRLGNPGNTTISTDVDSNITFTYVPPGTYNVTLYGADSIYNPNTGNTYFCETTYPDTPLVKQVIVVPYHKVGMDIPDTVCQNNAFTVKSLSDPRYEDFRWWMGNGDSIFTDTFQFQYTYTTLGNFRIDFKPTYSPTAKEKLCIRDTFKNITVIPIKADFDINPSSRAPIFSFTNTSSDAVSYLWDFGQPNSGRNNNSTAVNPSHNYKLELGDFTVCLIAFNKEGCPDTICKQVTNDYVPRLFVPNVFTPNEKDTLNGRFDIDIYLPLEYRLSIYNRWGEKVFMSESDGEGNSDVNNWNGIHYKTGMPCPEGVYYVVFDYEILGTDEVKQYTGSLTLFRK